MIERLFQPYFSNEMSFVSFKCATPPFSKQCTSFSSFDRVQLAIYVVQEGRELVLNGVPRGVHLMKLDILWGVDAQSRRAPGVPLGAFCWRRSKTDNKEKYVPVYVTLPGWSEDISCVRNYKDFPQNAIRYVEYLSFISLMHFSGCGSRKRVANKCRVKKIFSKRQTLLAKKPCIAISAVESTPQPRKMLHLFAAKLHKRKMLHLFAAKLHKRKKKRIYSQRSCTREEKKEFIRS